MGGDGNKRESDNIFIFDACRSRMEPAFIHGAILGECSGAAFNALASDPDSIANFETIHVETDFDDGASEIAPENVGKGKFGWDHSAANISVDWIHIDSGDFDEALGSAGFGRREVPVDDDFGRTGFVDEGSFHNSLRNPVDFGSLEARQRRKRHSLRRNKTRTPFDVRAEIDLSWIKLLPRV